MDLFALITNSALIVLILVFISAVIALALVFGFIVYHELKELRSEPDEKSEHADPCDTCVRWSECNGVDKECPRR